MATSLLKTVRESIRQEAVDDSVFFEKMIYYFELKVPDDALSLPFQSSFIYPLMLNPQSITVEEQFTVELTPTQGGGLYAEENGIVQRVIRIQGHTGFKPRPMPGSAPMLLEYLSVDKTYGRSLQPILFDLISGQRHFQYLQDAVFRTYSDLKKDPSVSEETQLIWHNPKDEEHWVVIPKTFTLERDSGGVGRTMYSYNIELVAVEPAEDADFQFSEDQGLFESIKSAIAMVKSGVDMIAGAINDLTALVDELESMVKGVASIIDSAAGIVDAASNFVEGVSDFIQSPLAIVESIGGVVDSALELRDTVEQAAEDITNLPDNIAQKFRQIGDGADRIATHPEVFESSTAAKIAAQKAQQQLISAITRTAYDAALNSTPPSTLVESSNLGTTVTSGDAISAQSELPAGRTPGRYTSVRPTTVEQGDTLVSLAVRYLGDGRLWQDIALANGLKPPFINDLADTPLTDDSTFPEALTTGGTILVPNYARPLQNLPVLPVLGVRPEEPAANHFLGADLKLEIVAGRPGAPIYDWVVDEAGGSVDAKRVAGLDNIKQQLTMRITTERGTNKMYSHVGVQPVVGLKNLPVDLATIKLRISQSLRADSRVAGVNQLKLGVDPDAEDALELDATVQLRGWSQATSIKVSGL